MAMRWSLNSTVSKATTIAMVAFLLHWLFWALCRPHALVALWLLWQFWALCRPHGLVDLLRYAIEGIAVLGS